MPLCRGRLGSVRVVTMRYGHSPAPVVNILVPLITNSSPSTTARVWMAAASEPAFGSVSEKADHWKLVEEGAAKGGRRPDRRQWRVARDVLVGPTPSIGRDRARAVLGRNYLDHQRPNRLGTIQMTTTKLDPALPDEAVTVDYLMEHVWIVGDPSEVADKIMQLYAESGGFGSLLTITTDSDDAGWDHESLRLLMDQVAPRIARLG